MRRSVEPQDSLEPRMKTAFTIFPIEKIPWVQFQAVCQAGGGGDQLAPVTAVSGGLVPLKRQVAACARGDLISPHLLPAQACNNLIDLDVAELVSAACTAYAELVQKDVSYPDYLSSFPSSSKKPSPVSQAQPMAGVFNFRDTACAMFSATNPQGLLCMDFLQVCLCNSCLPK